MSELAEGIAPEIFEDLHTSLAGLSLCYVINRPSELWEMLQLVKGDRAMVRGEIYRYDGLREAYRAAAIARTIIQKLDHIRDRTGTVIKGLRQFMTQVPGVPTDLDTIEFVIAFITISPKGRDAVAKWVADPAGQAAEAATKVKAITNIVEGYQRTLRDFKPAPPPPSSPLDKDVRPQLQPRFQNRETPLEGRLIPTGPPAIAPIDPLKTPSGPVPAIKVEPKPVAV